MRSRLAILASLATAMNIPVGNNVALLSMPMDNPYAELQVFSNGSRGPSLPRASQAKKRRLARRMHCGHIKNLRLRA